MKKWISTLVSAVIGIGLTAQVQAADKAAGKAKYTVCATCHGPNGEGLKQFNAPLIGGQYEWYIERQLKNFKDSVRGAHPKDTMGMQMLPMAKTLMTDKDVADMAAYVASLKPAKAAKTLDGDVAGGQAKFAVCSTCHGPDGKGMQAMNAPSLVGQHDWYIVRQVKGFKDGLRGTHAKDTFGATMRPMAMTLPTDKDIQDVAAYINTLK